MKRRRTWPDGQNCDTAKQPRLRKQELTSPTNSIPGYSAPISSIQHYVESFTHEPFKDSQSQIRLLQMLPGGNDNEDSLRYSIGSHNFDKVPDFTAISYTWGDESNQRSIVIQDKECAVRQNCHYALKHTYRHWTQGLLQSDLLWIDSVCINQKDAVEKGFQVSLMGEICANARVVLACVGPHTDDSEFLAEKAREVANFKYDCRQMQDNGFLCQDCRLPWEEWALSLGIMCLRRLCESCETFGRRVYWTRVWIIQEIAKATSLRVLCGNDILPWTAFSNLENFLGMEMDEIESMFQKYEELPICDDNSTHKVFLVKQKTTRVEEIFSQFAGSLCSEPRDHLYGLLSLIEWPDGVEPIFPDYTASIFDVAVQAAPYFGLEQIPEMLTAFQMTSYNETVRSLIMQRRRLKDFEESAIATDPADNFRPLTRENEDERGLLTLCGWIDVDQNDNMTCTLVKRNEMPDSLSEQIDSLDSLSEATYDSETSEQVTVGMASFLSSTPLEMRPQVITLNSDDVGLVCNDARKGDILVPLPKSSSHPEVFLVLRQNQGDIHDVIGQAVLLPGYEFGCEHGVNDEATEIALFTAQIELKLSAQDAILLFAQDIDDVRDLDILNDIDDLHHREDRWKRTITIVTEMPCGAARITKQTRMLAKDVVIRNRISYTSGPVH